MESQKIYQMGKIMLANPVAGSIFRGVPEFKYYKCHSESDAEFSLSMPCRVISAARYRFGPDFAMNGHGSDTYDILFIYSGSVTVSGHKTSFTASSDDVLFLHSSDSYGIEKGGDAPLDIAILRTSGLLASSYYEIITGRSPRPIRITDRDRLSGLIEKIVYYSGHPSDMNNVLIAHTMSSIFVMLYMSGSGGDSSHGYPQWLSGTLDYIEKNLGSNIDIPALAEKSDMSESLFYRVFRKHTGVSPYRYIINSRINRAQTLLRTTDLQVKFISHTVGFGSVNHFIAHFRKAVGVTPQEYRESIRQL